MFLDRKNKRSFLSKSKIWYENKVAIESILKPQPIINTLHYFALSFPLIFLLLKNHNYYPAAGKG